VVYNGCPGQGGNNGCPGQGEIQWNGYPGLGEIQWMFRSS
jgi:hypothetical protein